MKRHFLYLTGISLLLTLLPLLPAKLLPVRTAPEEEISTLPPGVVESTEPAPERCYRVLDITTGEILEVPVREYVIGALGAEMPASFEPEALKAQAVAAYTYAERQCRLSDARPELCGADFSNDPSRYQAYYTAASLEKLYGADFSTYYDRLCTAVDAVSGQMLTYEGEPIIAAFHAMSSGMTESAANVWGEEVAYLRPVDSTPDTQAPSYEESVTYSAQAVEETLTAAHDGLFLGSDPAQWFGEPVCSAAGTVLQQSWGTGLFTGQELRGLFSLRSAAFTVTYADGDFTFITHGFGHDVGMSQYGANAMAQEGADYAQILAYYYPGTKLTQG
ncbi:MAG: stage II sporulation protein D [Oscillospiraceae bacterium]|nr:stage II sporulation protein D [Oscillospiraceae bacterium]